MLRLICLQRHHAESLSTSVKFSNFFDLVFNQIHISVAAETRDNTNPSLPCRDALYSCFQSLPPKIVDEISTFSFWRFLISPVFSHLRSWACISRHPHTFFLASFSDIYESFWIHTCRKYCNVFQPNVTVKCLTVT